MRLPTNDEVLDELARRNLLDFTKRLWPQFHATTFHENYYKVLDLFCKFKIKNLIVTIPPQHGKSQGSSKYSPAYIFGKCPDKNIALMSYSTTFARKFNRHLQRVMDTPEYKSIFPDTYLNDSNVATISRGFLRNADEFEIVNHKGSFKAIGREGALTGNPVDIMIFDDLYKDAMEGNSPIVRDNVIEMIKSVAETRLHNDSQQLYVFTRWHEEDAIGYLEKTYEVINLKSLDDILPIEDQEGIFYKINFEAIKETDPTDLDPREIGEALYPQRHSLNRLLAKQKTDEGLFGCMYQGDPKPKVGLLYGDFNTYKELPTVIKSKDNYTDTADSGDNYLCSVCYDLTPDKFIYVTDIVYSQQGMEITEDQVSLMLKRNMTKRAHIESNNGGKGFARVIKKNCPEVTILDFTQSQNKEARILTNASEVTKWILFPIDWETRWPLFANHLKNYKRLFAANKYDDAADVVTGIIEKTQLAVKFYFK